MRFIKLLLVALCLCQLPLFSQQPNQGVKVRVGPVFKNKRSVPLAYFGSDSSGHYMLFSGGKKGFGNDFLYRIGHDLLPKERVRLTSKVGSEIARTLFVREIGDKLYHFSTITLPGQRSYYYQRINKEDMSLGENVFIGTITTELLDFSRSRTFFRRSPGSDFVTLAYIKPAKLNGPEKLVVNVFDKQMNPLWTKEYQFPFENRLFNIRDIDIEYDGRLSVKARRKIRVSERVRGKPDYEYHFFILNPDGSTEEVQIDWQGKFINGMTVSTNKKGDFVLAGFYSELNEDGLAGTYFLRIDSDEKKAWTPSFHALDIDFFNQNMTAAKAKRVAHDMRVGFVPKELRNYTYRSYRPMSDGGVRLIGEHELVLWKTLDRVVHHYGDIAVINLKPNGEIDWAKRIGKHQRTGVDHVIYSSYGMMESDNTLAFFFNDNEKNRGYDGVGRVAPMRKNMHTVLTMAEVDEKGELSRSVLLSRELVDTKVRPDFAIHLDNGDMLLFGHLNMRRQRFIKVKYP